MLLKLGLAISSLCAAFLLCGHQCRPSFLMPHTHTAPSFFSSHNRLSPEAHHPLPPHAPPSCLALKLRTLRYRLIRSTNEAHSKSLGLYVGPNYHRWPPERLEPTCRRRLNPHQVPTGRYLDLSIGYFRKAKSRGTSERVVVCRERRALRSILSQTDHVEGLVKENITHGGQDLSMRGHAGELGGERGPDRTGKDEDEARRMDSEEQGDSARTAGVTRERPRDGEGSRESIGRK